MKKKEKKSWNYSAQKRIVMVSTPNRPDGLFNKIEKESFESCIYKKVFLDYTYGLGKIYSQEEIEKARRSPSFPREYELQYQGLIGNVFSPRSIENCQKIDYNPDQIIRDAKVSIGIDPSFGSKLQGQKVTGTIISLPGNETRRGLKEEGTTYNDIDRQILAS